MDYVENDVLCTAFSYARHSKAMEEVTGFGINDCLSIHHLDWVGNILKVQEQKKMRRYTHIMINTWDGLWGNQ